MFGTTISKKTKSITLLKYLVFVKHELKGVKNCLPPLPDRYRETSNAVIDRERYSSNKSGLLFLLIIKSDNCKFCETRSKRSVEVLDMCTRCPPRDRDSPSTDHDRYSREIELYGWHSMKDN